MIKKKRTPPSTLGKMHPSRNLQTFDDPWIDTIIDKCRDRRIASKVSQREIAGKVGCAVRTIVFLELHQNMPSVSLFNRYANACGFVLVLSEFR